MELEGTIVMDIPMVEGVSKAGKAWKKKEWVLETPGMYPRRVKFHVFGERADQLNFEVGKAYKVDFDLESREFNGRWYTDVSVYGARPADAAPMAQQPFGTAAPQTVQAGSAADPFASDANSTDDLPF